MKRAAKNGKSHKQTEADMAGKEALRAYLDRERGNYVRMARDTGISIAVISKMVNRPTYIITLDAALLMELATQGELTVDVLCPSRAELVSDIFFLRVHRGNELRAIK